jgi:hypothetical protein
MQNENGLYITNGLFTEMLLDRQLQSEVAEAYNRYQKNDWGELCEEDKAQNLEALNNGGRTLGAYDTSKGTIYIITDDTQAEPTVTTILFADEY